MRAEIKPPAARFKGELARDPLQDVFELVISSFAEAVTTAINKVFLDYDAGFVSSTENDYSPQELRDELQRVLESFPRLRFSEVCRRSLTRVPN